MDRYRDTRTGEYGLAKLSEADGVAKDIEERAKRCGPLAATISLAS